METKYTIKIVTCREYKSGATLSYVSFFSFVKGLIRNRRIIKSFTVGVR